MGEIMNEDEFLTEVGELIVIRNDYMFDTEE